MNLRENDLCSYCSASRETILHLFVECPHVVTLWNAVENWLARVAGINVSFSPIDILFGRTGPNMTLINHLLLETKQYVFSQRITNRNLELNGIIAIIKKSFKVEKYLAKINMRTDACFRKWACLYNVMNDNVED